MKKLSLRIRLLLLFTGISCLIWICSGLFSWFESREKIDEFFDQYQILLARQLASADWSGLSADSQKATNRIIGGIDNADEEDEAIGFAVFDRAGKMIFHDNENGKDFIFSPRTGSFVNQNVDDEEWRIVWVDSADKNYVIAVGQEMEYRTEVTLDMVEEFLTPWLCGLLILLGAVIYFVGREFSSFRRLAKELEARRPDDLSPLSDKDLPDEIKPLTTAMNGLLRRIDGMIKREKSFISDSAHELRSPLTALKVQLEVLELAEDDAGARRSAAAKMGQGIERCARLVEQLLLLSKLESGLAMTDEAEDVSWPQIVGSLAAEYDEALRAKKQILKTDVTARAPIDKGNSVLLAAMLRNLLDNAVKYSPEGATVAVRISADEIEVHNSGVKIADRHLRHLSERFFRPAGQKENGSGLGLSIVGKIAALHGCKMEFDNSGDGFSVIICKE